MRWPDEAYFGSGTPIQIDSMEGVTQYDRMGHTMIHSMANTNFMKHLEKQFDNEAAGVVANQADPLEVFNQLG